MKNYLNNFTGKLKEMICTLRELLVILPHSKNNSSFMEWMDSSIALGGTSAFYYFCINSFIKFVWEFWLNFIKFCINSSMWIQADLERTCRKAPIYFPVFTQCSVKRCFLIFFRVRFWVYFYYSMLWEIFSKFLITVR